VADNNIDLTATFDVSDATKEIKKFGDTADKSIDELNNSVDKLQKNISDTSNKKIDIQAGPATQAINLLKGGIIAAGAAIAANFTINAVSGFFNAIIDESIDAENNLNALNASLQRAGTYSAESSQEMQDFASALMAVSTADDDVIIGQLAIARNFTKTDEQARQLVSAALDLSAATGDSLDTSVEQLGKTLDGTAGRLNETVPALRGLSEEALKSGEAIDIVAEQFGGAATSKLNTFQGAMASTGNQFGNLLASMGDFITKNPIIIQAVKEVSNMFSGLTEKIGDSGKQSNTFVTRGLLSIISAVRQSIPALSGLGVVFNTIGVTIDLVVKSVQNLIDIFFVLYDSWNAVSAAFDGDDEKLITSFNSIGVSVDKIIKRTDELGVSFANVLKTDKWDELLLGFDGALERMQQSANKKPIEIKTSVITPDKKTVTNAAKEAEKETPIVEVKTTKTTEKKESDDLLKRQNELFEKFISDLANLPSKLISGAGKGAEGASQVVPDLLSGLASTLGQGLGAALGGPIGAASGSGLGSFIGELIKLSVGNKDEIAAKIDAFFEEIPKVLDNIIENLPMVVEKVMANLPSTIAKFLEIIPKILLALAEGMDELAYGLAMNSPAFAQFAVDLPIAIIQAATLAAINIVKGSIEGFSRLAKEKLNEAFRVSLEKLLAIGPAVGKFFNKVGAVFDDLSFDGFSVSYAKLADQLAGVFDSLFGVLEDVKNFFKSISLKEIGTDIGNALQDMYLKLIDGIGSLFSMENLEKMVQAVIDGIKSIFDSVKLEEERFNLGGTGGKWLGELGGAVKRVLGLAKGGVVPSGFPNDSYPALLTSNEVVVPADTTGNLFSLINDLAGGNGGTGNGETNDLLRQLIKLTMNQQKTIEVKLDRDTLARAIVSLNKDNRRLA
jgi:hypothetical protein